MTKEPPNSAISGDDRMMAALAYPVSLAALLILLSGSLRARPFQRYHAVQALAANVALGLVVVVLSVITAGLGACLVPLVFVPLLYWGYHAYLGEWLTIPLVTDFCRGQGWLQRNG